MPTVSRRAPGDVARDGRVVHLRDEGVIVLDENEEPLYLQGYLLDITQQIERYQFLEKLSGLLHFDRGLTESVRQALGAKVRILRCAPERSRSGLRNRIRRMAGADSGMGPPQ